MMPMELYGKHTDNYSIDLEGLSLLEIIRKHRVDVDDENRTNCPFHEDSERSFHYAPSDDSFWCDFCGANGKSVQFVMFFYNTDFRTALRHFGMTKSPNQILEMRREAELARKALKPSLIPDESLVAANLNERIEKLTTILYNMETAIKLMQERVKRGANHRGISSDESVALMQSEVINKMLKNHEDLMAHGGAMLACGQLGLYDSQIAQCEKWLTFTPPVAE